MARVRKSRAQKHAQWQGRQHAVQEKGQRELPYSRFSGGQKVRSNVFRTAAVDWWNAKHLKKR